MTADHPDLRSTQLHALSPARLRLLDTAAAVFAERGYDATSVAQLAARYGATQGAVFYYYASKFAVYLAVYERNLALVGDRIQDALDSTTGSPATVQLHALVRAYARHVLANRHYHAALLDTADRRDHLPRNEDDRHRLHQLDARRTAIEETVRGLVVAAQGAGLAQDVPPGLAARTLLGALDSIVVSYRPAGEEDGAPASVADHVTSLLLFGLVH